MHRKLDPEQRRLVDFAAMWLHYGGGSREDIFVSFGLTEEQYFQRLLHLLTHRPLAVGLDAGVRNRMLAVGKARLSPQRRSSTER